MKHIYSLLSLVIIISTEISGQYSNKQIGLRAGYGSGIFYQVAGEAGSAEIAYNVMLGMTFNGIRLTGLKIIYENPLSNISPDLYLAWGYGGHAGFTFTDHLYYFGERHDFHGERFCPLIGVDGWLAAEYRVRDIPLIISLNLKPYMEFTVPAFVRIMPADIGISVSYAF